MRKYVLLFVFTLTYILGYAQPGFCPRKPIAINPGACSTQLGFETSARGDYAFAAGYLSTADYIHAISMGKESSASTEGIALGSYCTSFKNAYSIGTRAAATGELSFAFGSNIESQMLRSMTFGIIQSPSYKLVNTFSNSIMMGMNVTTPTLLIVAPEIPDYQTKVGKVGINLNVLPKQDLHVKGNILVAGTNSTLLFSDEVSPSNDGWGAWGIEYETDGLNFWRPYQLNGGTMNYVLFLNDKGSVGVGTNKFSEKFFVAGNAKITEDLTVGEESKETFFIVNGTSTTNGDNTVIGVNTINGNNIINGTCNINGNLLVSTLIPVNNNQSMVIAGPDGTLALGDIPLGDQMGSHLATQNIKTNNHFITNDDDGSGKEGIFIAANGSVGIKTNETSTYDLTIKSQNTSNASMLLNSPSEYKSSIIWAQSGSTKLGFGVDNSVGHIYSNDGTRLLTFNSTNKIGIGVQDADLMSGTHVLFVGGGITAEEVKVKVRPWPDYVFKPEYSLLSLSELEEFVKNNNHLPEIPTSSEVSENGVNLGEMNALLLKKIEELTLYVIELNNKINELENSKQ